MKKKNTLRYMYWALPCMLLFAGCENEVSSDEESREPVELQVNPMVAWTRSAVNEATGMSTVAVYATGTDYNSGNNYAVYTYSNPSWGNADTNKKIFLTNTAATIYAYYPTTTEYDATNLDIPVTVLEGSDVTTITGVNNATDDTKIASADGEVDCMWATPVSGVTNKQNNGVTLAMKHALSMVSFRVYKAADYEGEGKLTKFVVSNKASGTVLSRGTTPKMKITDGVITPGAVQAATYTRSITSGYTLVGTDAASNRFSILVLPISTVIAINTIQATFTIDGADYSVDLTDPTATGVDGWKPGNNNLYTVKLSGTELAITTVTVTKWTEVAGGTLEIK